LTTLRQRNTEPHALNITYTVRSVEKSLLELMERHANARSFDSEALLLPIEIRAVKRAGADTEHRKWRVLARPRTDASRRRLGEGKA